MPRDLSRAEHLEVYILTVSASIKYFTPVISLLCIFIGCSRTPYLPSTPPRYRLQVGQELVYSGRDEFKYTDGKFIYIDSWKVWVVRENEDSSWRLIIRNGNIHLNEQDNAEKRPAEPPPESVTFGYCDLFPDGRLVDNESSGFYMNIPKIVPLLPKDQAEIQQGWTGKEKMDTTAQYRVLSKKSDKEHFIMEVVRVSPMNIVHGFEIKEIIVFDVPQGLPEKIDSDTKQTYGINGQGHGVAKLDEVNTRSPEWCSQFAADAEQYFKHQAAYRRIGRERHIKADELKKSLDVWAEELKAAKGNMKSQEIQKQIDELLAKFEQEKKYAIKDAQDGEAILDKPAAPWDTKDLDGNPHALKDYLGKVVILDFWYRGCGWCVRAMPQVKEVAAHFADKPVVVLGMNTDAEATDAKFVVEKLGLNYTNLDAKGIPEKVQCTRLSHAHHHRSRRRSSRYSKGLFPDAKRGIDQNGGKYPCRLN